MQMVMEEAELRVKKSLPMEVHLPNTSSHNKTIGSSNSGAYYGLDSGLGSLDPKKRKGLCEPLEKAFNIGAREQLDGEIARMFYMGGLSFHFARNPHYVRAFKNAFLGYVPPAYNALRTTLLQKEKSNIEHLLEPIKGEQKNKFFISNLLIDAIREIGPKKVVQVVTDNAPVCKAAGLLVESRFQHIFWTPCIVHTLNLALKSICSPSPHPRYDDIMEECGWIAKVSSDVFSIKKFIVNHSMRLAMFNEHSKLKLLSVYDTRFASTIVMLKRFKQIKHGLEHMEDDVEKARAVKEKILDEYFWVDIDYILRFTAPIYEMLRMADTDTPCLHLIYEWWDSMIEKVKIAIFRKERKQLNDSSRFFYMVHGILVERRTKSSAPLHGLAYSLNPRYYSEQWLEEAPSHVAPHQDLEVILEKKKCIDRYFSNEYERRKVNEENAAFASFFLHFSSSNSINDRAFMALINWWIVHGASTPTRQSFALRLLGQPCSSSCCERNWSTYNFIHYMKMNKMTPQRAEDLVFVHTNLRLLLRRSPIYKECVSQLWDVGGDGFDSMALEDAGVLKIADLSLEEPELETVLFSSVDNVNDE
ncbi:hypothetical protein LWI28_001806 [Acer negundo]|uniref:DUF659 domain-containing protein n=1 Tax=Acer negundo TaxID=4023 RepID=A0AAD5NF12_ACENE|nr:hypothetical protein LWI28_001806 [Acer negundo]